MVSDLQKSCLFDVKNNQDSSGRRRRIMNFKLSFRKKKKSRYDCEFINSNNLNTDAENVPEGNQSHQQKTLSNVGKDDRPKGIINKLFSFRKGRRKNSNISGDLSTNVRTKSLDFLSDPINTNDKKQNGIVSCDLGHETAELNICQSLRQTGDVKQGKSSPRFSLSSPNLACVEWTSFDSFSEQVEESETRKRGSLRRSRASLVFPVSEIGSTVFTQLKHTISEKNLPCRPNVNKVQYSQSCLPLDDSKIKISEPEHEKEIIFTVNKDIIRSDFTHRTPDGRSPHPGKRNICSPAFSLPEIFEDEKNKVKKQLNVHGSTNTKTIDEEIVNIDSKIHKTRQYPISYSQYSIISDTNPDSIDEDAVFSCSKNIPTRDVKKTLGRYISCPGIIDNNLYFNSTEEGRHFFPVDSINMRKDIPLKPYSPHIRPYSLHEGMIAANNLENYGNKQALSVGDFDAGQDESLPPDDKINLPSKDLPLAFAEALWDHTSDLKTELKFCAGDMIAVYFMNNRNWWWGIIDERKGWFPSSHVRLLVDQNLDDGDDEMAVWKGVKTGPRIPLLRHNTLSLLGLQDNVRNENDLRSRCVQELLTSEKDYVKTLRDVSEGYLKQTKKKPDMFKQEDIDVIFSNIEQIYHFHKMLYHEMQKRIDQTEMHKSQVGDLFVCYSAEFDIYSEYCNNHPSACARLSELQKEKRYRLFFESCRLLQQMISLSIDSFLLTPVQKICKYPLQLNELLKHTPSDHADHDPLQAAVQVMRDVASSINERKRKFENLTGLAEWQLNIDSWQGNDLLEDSSELIKRGIIERLNGLKLEEIYLSLFDHQIIICKKESYRKNSKMSYIERVNLDCASFESVSEMSGQNIQYLIKIRENEESKTHCFLTRTSEEKDKWIKALMKEKQIVKNEKRIGFAIPKSVRLAAMESARTKKNSDSKKEHRRRKSLTDPFQGLEFGANIIRRSFRLRRTQSLREKKSTKGQ